MRKQIALLLALSGALVLGAAPAGATAEAVHRLPPPPPLSTNQLVQQGASRLRLLGLRALTLPAHFWPFNRIAAHIAHGEPFTGISPASATEVAADVAREGGRGVVIGRLSPAYRDIWTVRESERSFVKLIDEIAAAKARDPKIDASVAYDPDSFGLQLRGFSQAEREQMATDGMLRVARYAKARGVPLEIDSTESAVLPLSMKIGKQIVDELKMPVRLALAARYKPTEKALLDWAALGKAKGIKLGVRLVKGSYLEADNPDTLFDKKRILAKYKRVVHRALERADHLDVAVATQNEEMWAATNKFARKLDAPFSVQVIRGVNPTVQAKMRATGKISREYVSYGIDAPVFALTEMVTTWRERRALARQLAKDVY